MEQDFIETWCKNKNSDLFIVNDRKINHFVNTMFAGGLTSKEVEIVLRAIDDSCKHCFNSKPCYCWNDE